MPLAGIVHERDHVSVVFVCRRAVLLTAAGRLAAVSRPSGWLSVRLGPAHVQRLANEAAVWRGPLGCLPGTHVQFDDALVREVLGWRAAGGKPAEPAPDKMSWIRQTTHWADGPKGPVTEVSGS